MNILRCILDVAGAWAIASVLTVMIMFACDGWRRRRDVADATERMDLYYRRLTARRNP
jgi:hypothetical protein